MLNFSNLNDIEFEYLCKDVLSRMLDTKLQRFGKGRDGGIDLTDDAYERKVIVQVKHYIKTDVNGLMASLRKEVPKVKENNPKEYYVCCSKELTPQNKSDIYDLFSDYMESTNNIISTTEINDFLEEEGNKDILRKHFKLWIESTNILTDIFSNDILIDSEVLLSDIKELAHMFVRTTAYDKAVECLDKNNVLILVGNPGVGKTITSKMLVLDYASRGYKVRYTTDGADLASLKKALGQARDDKEIILLDDCFGQAYFNMKESQESELLNLIKYVKLCPNKVLVMNSRVTIYQEASLRTPDLVRSLDKKEYKAYVIDMSNVSLIEKAKIFYNHLYFGKVPTEYREDIKLNKNYIKIVRHNNYNPRIMEFVTSNRQLVDIPPSSYADFVLKCLNEPTEIWDNEYSRRLKEVDRILLNTIYSLTNTTISIDVVKSCFEYRISKMQGIDLSINHFEQSLKRLQDSMIKIVDDKGYRKLSVANPSVNDFLRDYLERNTPEKQKIIEYSHCFLQLVRLLTDEIYEERLKGLFADTTILNFTFETEKQKREFIVSYCVENNICDVVYKPYFEKYMSAPESMFDYKGKYITFPDIYIMMLENDVGAFYQINSIIRDFSKLEDMFYMLTLEEQVIFINQIDTLFDGIERSTYIKTIEEAINEAVDWICCNVSADEYDVDVSHIIDYYCYKAEDTGHIDVDAAIEEVDRRIAEQVVDSINDILSRLSSGICDIENVLDDKCICVDGSASIVEAYLTDDYPDFYYEEYRERDFDVPEIEYIFERL